MDNNQQNTDPTQNQQTTEPNQPTGSGQNAAPVIDYDKIQQMLSGTLAAKEDTALKAYFKQQGLTQEEMTQAIDAFKAQKAANTPDITGLQNRLAQAQKAALTARIESAATVAAVSLGIDAKTIPYVIKMADLGAVVDANGAISAENLQTALNKVLEDIPGLKPLPAAATGFVQVGAASPQNAGTGQTPQKTVATKPWNRFNH